jgi:DNA-binding MarR family transcriptional regulator
MDEETPDKVHELFMDLVRVTGLLQSERTLAGEQISMSQAFCLHVLDTGVPLSQRDLGERLHLEKSTVSRLAAELERRGLVERERDPANRRLYRLRITRAGRTLHGRLRTAMHKQYVGWVAAMTPTERAALVTGLSALVRSMADTSDADRSAVGDVP